MKTLRFTGVPEHYSYPIITALKNLEKRYPNTWEYSPGGTGEMLEKLKNREVDVAILLTDGFLKSQSTYKPIFVDFYVSSPLHWGIHTFYESSATSVNDLEKTPVLISRKFSGSHLMAQLLQKQENWKSEISLKQIGDLKGALDYCTKNKEDFIFLWEKFTTEKFCKPGAFKSVGTIATPWPAFTIALDPDAFRSYDKTWITNLFEEIKSEVIRIIESEDFVNKIAEFAALDQQKIEDWLSYTHWYQNKDQAKTLAESQAILMEANIIENAEDLHFLSTH